MALDERTSSEETRHSRRQYADVTLSARRHRGRRVLLIVVAASVVLAALAFWAGTAVRGGAGSLPQHVSEPVVTVPVRHELLINAAQASGTIKLPAGVPVVPLEPQLSAPGAQPVITGFPWHVGKVANDGDMLVEVAGEPIFLLSGAIPSYRDLQVGDSGKDVAELQAALRGAGFAVDDPEGTYGLSTAAAVSALYHAHGYEAPTSKIPSSSGHAHSSKADRRSGSSKDVSHATAARLPVWSVVYVKTLPARVSAIHVATGASLHGGTGILDLTSGAPIADLAVEPSTAATLRRGMRVRLRKSGGAQVWGRVQSVATAKSGSSSAEEASAEGAGSSSASGSVVVVSLPTNAPGMPVGTRVEALIVRESSHVSVLVVPISAVQIAADGGEYVQVRRKGRSLRVEVTQGMTAGGNVAVSPLPGDFLHASEQVVVPN